MSSAIAPNLPDESTVIRRHPHQPSVWTRGLRGPFLLVCTLNPRKLRWCDYLAYNNTVRILVLTAALILGSDTGVRGQSAGGAVESAVDRFARVAVDLPSRSFEGVLPFDVPFSLTGIAPEGTVGVSVQFAEIPSSGFPSSPLWTPTVPALWKPLDPSVRDQPFRVFFSKTLDARRRYRFRFTVQRQRPEDSTEFVADGETPRNIYVSADAGLLYGIDIETAALYIGSNVYFRPVNKRAPLGVKGSFLRRAAMTVGFTVTSIADDDNRTRSDMFGQDRKSVV